MHQYTLDTDIRKKLFILFYIISVSAAGLSETLNVWASANLHPGIRIAISASTAYAAIFWLFNKYLWKLIPGFLGIPDLNGTWACCGEKYDHTQASTGTWSGELVIVQTFTQISIALKTESSRSKSRLAGIVHDQALGASLSYEYQNIVLPGHAPLHDHPGFCRLTLTTVNKKTILEGLYFNGPHRWTHGQMRLEKKENQ